jgi:hypothetical protein
MKTQIRLGRQFEGPDWGRFEIAQEFKRAFRRFAQKIAEMRLA